MVLGYAVGFLLGLGLASIKTGHLAIGFGALFGFPCASISVWIAERKGKVKSFEEINRPMKLFPPD